MPKTSVLRNKQVKRYFKRNKQWLIGVAAIVIVFFVGLMYASASGHLATFSAMLRGQVAGLSSVPPFRKGYAKMDVGTTALASVTSKIGAAKAITCGTKCTTAQVKVGEQVVLTATHPLGPKFLGWVEGEGVQLCRCADRTSKECKFTVTPYDELIQGDDPSISAISCFAKFDAPLINQVSVTNRIPISGIHVSMQVGTGENINCGVVGCSPMVPVGTKVKINTFADKVAAKFVKWEVGNADLFSGGSNAKGFKCPCTTNQSCEFTTSASDASNGIQVSCRAVWNLKVPITVNTFNASALDRPNSSFPGIVVGSGFSCRYRVHGGNNPISGVCDITTSGLESMISYEAKPDNGYKFVKWGDDFKNKDTGFPFKCACKDTTNPKCTFEPQESNCMAFFTPVGGVDVIASVDSSAKNGSQVSAIMDQKGSLCGLNASCKAQVPIGRGVSLTAQSSFSQNFAAWSSIDGAQCPCQKNDPVCSFIVQEQSGGGSYNCIASFKNKAVVPPGTPPKPVSGSNSSTTPSTSSGSGTIPSP